MAPNTRTLKKRVITTIILLSLTEKNEYISTYVTHDSEEEILDWAERFGFIKEDIPKCENVRALSADEVAVKNEMLYNAGQDVSRIPVPPTIGEVQLN